MNLARSQESAELKLDEFRNPNLSVWKPLKPVSKFGEVLFLYFLPDLEADKHNVRVNNSGVVAVVH